MMWQITLDETWCWTYAWRDLLMTSHHSRIGTFTMLRYGFCPIFINEKMRKSGSMSMRRCGIAKNEEMRNCQSEDNGETNVIE